MGGKPRARIGLADEWRRWVSESLMQGADPADVVEGLVSETVPRALAENEVDIAASTIAHTAGPYRRMRQVLDLLAQTEPSELSVRTLCDVDEFHDRYFTASRPVIFSDGCAAMKAASWSFAELRRRFGDEEIQVATKGGRGALVSMKFAEAVDQMLADPPADLYVTSKCKALKGPLAELTHDLTPVPPFIDGHRARRNANLWLGPKTSLSPLHHDTTHVYFCQLVGRKRYSLIAPWAANVMLRQITQPSDADFDVNDPGEVKVHHAIIEPGQSLFIPAGWWHRVEALEASISASLSAYPWSADFDWYRPANIPV